MLKLNKRILFILAVLSILIIIPFSFAEDVGNETLSVDEGIVEIETVGDDIVYVDDVDDEGDGSADNPYNSVSKAVENYNSSQNSNVYIKNGEYIIDNQIDINKDITLVGESKEGTILDAKGQNSIFKVSADSKVTFINLTFKNAKSGSALLLSSDKCVVNVDNCNFDNNTDGAIYYKSYFSSSVSLSIVNSSFTNNYNKDNGGAIYIYGGTLLNITNTVFDNNGAPIGENDVSKGGAVYCAGNLKNIYINYCNFKNNYAITGSAIAQYCGGNLYISNSIFTNNNAPGNSRYKLNSSVIYNEQSNPSELILYLNKNTFESNSINDEVFTKGNVRVEYLDKNTKITAGDVDKIVGDDFNYIVVLTDAVGNPLSGKTISVKLTNTYDDSVTIVSNITDSQGRATISLKTQKAGKYSAVATFEGDADYDEISKTNNIYIKTENAYNLILDETYIHLTEGDSYNVTGMIYDQYLIPTNALDGNSLSIDWFDNFGRHMALAVSSVRVSNGQIVYDINRLHLVTRDDVYIINFNISSYANAVLTVDLSKDFSNINGDLDTFYVSKDGNDTTGDGSESNPLASIQTALSANYKYGGGKTIVVKEGVYEISTFNVLGNVTIIGDKSKTILRQTNGILGMLEIDNGNIVHLINLTFIDGYATPSPDALIHVADDSVVYIAGCEFLNNSAIEGGAISISTGGSVYVDDSYFHDNKAILGRNGGAIYVDRGYLFVSNSIFENNTAGDGGAIYLGFPSEATIINSTFINNSATGSSNYAGSGGAIFTRSSNCTIENSTFIENSADYGGGVFIDYGAVYIYKSYFENNRVSYSGVTKGSAVQGSYTSYCNFTMHYSILISDEINNYLVYIPNLEEENYTANVDYNYWKTNSLNQNIGTNYTIRMEISIDNEYIYTGDVVEFTVKLVGYNPYEGTFSLDEFAHDFAVKLIPTIGNIENNIITIKNNKALFTYNATAVGLETIIAENILTHTRYRVDIQDGSDKIKLNSTIEINPGKITSITVTFDDNISTNITIRVNDESYSVEVNNSKALLEVETLPGDYTIKVVYPGNNKYKGFVESRSTTVSKFKSFITVEDIVGYYNSNFQAVLKDDEGNPLTDEKVTININGTNYTATTNEQGMVIIELKLPSIGEYNVITSFAGNKNYNASESYSTITVKYANIKLDAPDNTIITPVKGSFSVTLTDNNGRTVKNTKVIITFNGADYDVTTDNNGIATLDLTNNGLKVGDYKISAKVEGTSVYSAASINSTISVVKATAIIKAENITVFANSGQFIVTLNDENANPISNASIIVKIFNNNEYALRTDENGTAILNLTLIAGTYNVLVKLDDGNPVYAGEDLISTITVKENIVNIKADDVTIYYSNGKFIVILSDVDGKAVENERLIVNINNNDYLATTDENGIASININLPIGNYVALIKFEGNSIFQANSATSIVKVVSSISSSDMTRAYNSPYDFQAILKDQYGGPISNQNVDLLVNGKYYTAKTDNNGILNFAGKLSVGTYAITITNPVTGEKTSNYAKIVGRLTGNKNVNMLYLSGGSYKVRVVGDNGKFVGKGVIVKMTIGGKSYNVKTNANGYAIFKVNLKPKTYTITAKYKGQTVKNTVKVKSIIKAKNLKAKKSAKVLKIKVTLKKVNKKYLKGKKVTLKFKGKTYKAKTNKKGVATFKVKKNILKKLKVGKKYTYKVTYKKDTVSKKITIKK